MVIAFVELINLEWFCSVSDFHKSFDRVSLGLFEARVGFCFYPRTNHSRAWRQPEYRRTGQGEQVACASPCSSKPRQHSAVSTIQGSTE